MLWSDSLYARNPQVPPLSQPHPLPSAVPSDFELSYHPVYGAATGPQASPGRHGVHF